MGIELERFANLEYRMNRVEQELRSLHSLLLEQEAVLSEVKEFLDSLTAVKVQ